MVKLQYIMLYVQASYAEIVEVNRKTKIEEQLHHLCTDLQ
jgi:hypothetical protein